VLAANNTLDDAAKGNPASLQQAKAFPLNKKAFGGVLATQDDYENQNRIIGLSQSSPGMRLGNTIYTNRLMNGPHPLPIAQPPARQAAAADGKTQTNPVSSGAPSVISALPDTSPSTTSTSVGSKNALPQNLIDDMIMMKGLKQYQGLAAQQSPIGSRLDVQN
jgi:hypothetical protein